MSQSRESDSLDGTGAPGGVSRTERLARALRDAGQYISEAQQTPDDVAESLLDAFPVPVFHKDADGVYRGCNRAFEEALGIRVREMIGKRVQDVAPPELARIYDQMDRALLRAGGSQRYEGKVRFADGRDHDVIFYKSCIQDEQGRVLGIIGTMLDISERKEAEALLRGAHWRVAWAREEERRAVARELHDSIGQEMVAIHMQLRAVAKTCREANCELAADRVEQLNTQCRRLTGKIHDLCRGLYPASLDELGLISSLAQLVRDCGPLVDIELDYASELEETRWSRELEITLFRIAQEAVSNALRHAEGSPIRVSVAAGGGRIELSVADRGGGFDQSALSRGLGFKTMRERAESAGGELKITTGSEGTTVTARIPTEPRTQLPCDSRGRARGTRRD